MAGRQDILRYLAVFLALVLTCAPGAAAWDCLNVHRNLITVTAGPSGHSEEVRIDLTSADFPADYVFTPDGADIRVVLASDDTTPVDHIVTGWDPILRTATIFIRPPGLAPSSSTGIYLYYGNSGAASLGNVAAVFPATGLRLHSRVSAADPTDAASAIAAFAAATSDVYDAVRASVTGLNNRALGGANGDFGWCISAMVEVTPATAGTWGFRYGADFGRGGHLYVRETELEQQWNDDLWWANNFANTAETLEGTITLAPGWHRYEALGFEGCCDGAVGWQAQAPGGPWQDLSTANFSMRAARCVVTTASISKGAPQSCSTVPNASKQVSVVSDPLGNPSPFAIPGAVVEYQLNVTNQGQRLDNGSVMLTDALPTDVKLIVTGGSAFTLSDGATASDLNLSWINAGSLSDGVSFSTDGVNFTYSPIPDSDGADAAITHVRFNLDGAMRQHIGGSADPSFTISFRAIVK